MELILDLENVNKEYRLEFTKYIINILEERLDKLNDSTRYKKMEEYINSGIIKWRFNKPQYISIYNLYRLIPNNLKIRKIDDTTFEIYLDRDIIIPDSFTLLYDLISLLEYGTLSMRKIGKLSEIMKSVAKNLDSFYNLYMLNKMRG